MVLTSSVRSTNSAGVKCGCARSHTSSGTCVSATRVTDSVHSKAARSRSLKNGVSRQTAQRLVSFAVSEKLIRVRLDHPIGRCLELSERVKEAYGIDHCEIVPADPDSPSTTIGVAEAAAAELERYLVSQHPITVAMGTGRMLRAMVEQLTPMDCPQHKVVSLVGNIGPDGSASLYDVVSRIGDRVKAPHYPMREQKFLPEELEAIIAYILSLGTPGSTETDW